MADLPKLTQLPQTRNPVLNQDNTFSLPWIRFFQQLLAVTSGGTVDPAVIAALEAEIAAALAAAEQAEAEAAEALAAAEAAQAGITTFGLLGVSALDERFAKIALTVPSIMTVGGSPVYNVGTLAVGLATQNANLVFAGPTSGAAAIPTFRALTLASADFANQGTIHTVLHGNATGNPSWSAVDLTADVSNVLPFANGGTGNSSYTNGQLLIGNTTTGGLTKATLTAGTNVTITNSAGGITIAASGGGGGGGGLVLLEEHVIASSSASVNFTTRNVVGQSGATFQSDYDEYQLHIVNEVSSANNLNLAMRVSTNGGISYDSTTGHYAWTLFYTVPGTFGANGTQSDSGGWVSTFGTTSIPVGINSIFNFTQPTSSTLYKFWFGQTATIDTLSGTRNSTSAFSGSYLSTTAVNAFQIFTNSNSGTGIVASGNIVSGIFRLYGISH